MKWRNKPVPVNGDERVVIRFAWRPVRLDDGYTVWLERYASHEVFNDPNADEETANSYLKPSWICEAKTLFTRKLERGLLPGTFKKDVYR